jgi:hypothetical protein
MIEHAFDGADFGQDFQDIRHILGKQPSRKNNIEGYSRVLVGVLHTSTQTDSSMSSCQRILDDLWRTRLSCGRMIRLLAHPLPPSRQQVVSLSQSSCAGRAY